MKAPLALVALLVLAGGSVGAHHSLTAMYDTSQRITLEAVVLEFHFVNPHPFVVVEATPPEDSRPWRLELDNRHELVRVGMSAETFRPGDRVVVTGSPGRDEAPRIYVRRLQRASDGFEYEQVGSSPRIRRPER
jgi:hypothetical protein